MDIRVTINGGRARVETISMLEDLWHDFEFFKAEASKFDQLETSVNDRLTAKRHQRAALLMLVFYLEGVLNQWLQGLLSEAEFRAIERKPIEFKIEKILERADAAVRPNPGLDVSETKAIRNALVHLKPGQDLELFDKINWNVLTSTENAIVGWLKAIELALGLARHPNTEAESKELRDALGTSDPERTGYTGFRKT